MEKVSDKFFKAFLYTLKFEGQYSNNPNDPGGETKYGISKNIFDKLNIRELTLDDAMAIYYNHYWTEWLELITNQKIINKILAARINIGNSRATEILQFTLAKYYRAPIAVDGILGKRTALAINKILKSPEETKMLIKLYGFELAKFYEDIGKEVFLKGWLKRALD